MDLETSTKVNSFHLKQLKVKSMSQKNKDVVVTKTPRLVNIRYLPVLWGEKIGYKSVERGVSIHPRIQSSLPTKHVNNDWVRVCKTPSYNE